MSQKQEPFQRGWVGFGRNYFHNLGSEPWHPKDNSKGLYSWGVLEQDQNFNPSKAYQYCKEIPNKKKKQANNNNYHDQLAPAACSSAATYFLSGSKHNRITTVGTVHGHVMNPVLEQTHGASNHASFSPFTNVSPSTTTIPLPLPCVELAAGRHFCLARLEGGLAVCSWGAGHFGQLGHGTTSFSDDTPGSSNNTSTYQATPKVIERLLPRMIGSPIAQVAAGDWHGMALSQEGTVYAWGCNRNMQCGRKSARANKQGSSAPLQMIPMPVTILDGDPDKADDPPVTIAKIVAGKAHSVAITKNTHQVYCWGASHYGQCASNSGSSTRTSKYTRNVTALPRRVHSLQEVQVIDVAAGDRHTLALTQGGRVFSWGAGAEGQLGIFPPIVCTPKPRLIHDLDFVAIAASELQQTNATNNSSVNALSTVPTITSVHTAGCSSYALSSSGHVYAWGSNDAGTLGLVTPPHHRLPYWEVGITPLPSDERLLQVRTFDSEHNVLLPRRIDALGHVDVEQITIGPSHAWFLGEDRSSQDVDTNNRGEAAVVVGRTLYEVQQMRKTLGGNSGMEGGSLHASSWTGSASGTGNSTNWGEDSLSQIDATNRALMSPSSTMPTDEEDGSTTTDFLSASMPSLEVSLESTRLGSNAASAAAAASSNGSTHSSDGKNKRAGRRHSDTALAIQNPPKSRHFSLSNLLRRLGGSRRHNNAAQENMDRSSGTNKNGSSHGSEGGKGKSRRRSGANIK